MKSSRASGKHKKSPAERPWLCTNCFNIMILRGVSPMLTVKCPHCGQVMGIEELFNGGLALIKAGFHMLDRCNEMISSYEEIHSSPLDDDDSYTYMLLSIVKKMARFALEQIPSATTISYISDESHSWIEKHREQDAYFDETPSSTLSRGTVVKL